MQNNNVIILKRTLELQDVLSLGTCSTAWRLSNGVLFDSMPASMFVSFFNLRPIDRPIVIKNRETLRVCHLIHFLSLRIPDTTMAQQWRDEILKICNVSLSYYKSHYRDVAKSEAKENKRFVEKIKTAFQKRD